MTEVLRQPATITLLVAHGGTLMAASAADFVAGADEIIEVSSIENKFLRDVVPAGAGYRHLRSHRSGLAHALNLGTSFASSEWVVISFGDERVARGWIDGVRSVLAAPGSYCIHLFYPESGSAIPVVAVRRAAFLYGAFDERFACGRLAALHWVFRIFPRPPRRVLTDEGVFRHCVKLIQSQACPAVDAPLAGLMELWHELEPGLRSALLEQAVAAPDATQRSLSALLDTESRQAMARGDPYRSGAAYEPKDFWESNSIDYIRWEIYQPDEPEILRLLRKVAPHSVLELGCGAGRNTRYFAGAKRYAGIDISMNLLHRAVERQEPCSIGILCGDIAVLPFADRSFDLVFSDSTVQHVTPDRIGRCAAEIARVSSEYICAIEYTEEARAGGEWFKQRHMFAHDYRRLFEPYCDLVWHADTEVHVHPARKEVFLFKKRQRG